MFWSAHLAYQIDARTKKGPAASNLPPSHPRVNKTKQHTLAWWYYYGNFPGESDTEKCLGLNQLDSLLSGKNLDLSEGGEGDSESSAAPIGYCLPVVG